MLYLNCRRKILDELIDIFDENGNYIKKEMKSVAHSKGHWHKSIHAYLVNDKKEIVIQKRSANKDFYPSIWDVSFAGHVGAGESTKSSAIRECQEELGICLSENEIEYLFTNPEKLHYGNVISNEFVDVFLCKKNFNKIVKQDEEIDDVKVIKLEEFISMIENKDQNLFPHYHEYERILPILKNIK